jgi:hypothetical protein
VERVFRFLRRIGLAGPVEYTAQFLHGLFRPRLLRSGATPEEEKRALPGDDLVPAPGWQATRAVTVEAPVEEVWPWIAQMGYGRGGWYGWFPLNRKDTAATRIIPEFQHPNVGEALLDGPDCDETTGAWAVKAVEPPTTLVLYSLRDPSSGRELDPAAKPRRYIDTGWAFYLDAAGPRTSRLLARTRVAFAPRWIALAAKIMGGGDTVMQRKLLEGIKVRAEQKAHVRPVRRPDRERDRQQTPQHTQAGSEGTREDRRDLNAG